MKLLGAKYVHYVNRNYNRTGTLWEGRFKCSLIDEEIYFLSCLRYIEMNPVRAGLADLPEFYPWSSYRFRAFGEKSVFLDLDPWYNNLGNNLEERKFNYRKFFQERNPEPSLKLIREMAERNGIVGEDDFKERIEQKINREIIFRLPGRPKEE